MDRERISVRCGTNCASSAIRSTRSRFVSGPSPLLQSPPISLSSWESFLQLVPADQPELLRVHFPLREMRLALHELGSKKYFM